MARNSSTTIYLQEYRKGEQAHIHVFAHERWILHLQNLSARGMTHKPKGINNETYGHILLGAWQLDSTFGLNQYGLPLYALIVVSGDYKPFASPGLLMFCSSDIGTSQEIEAVETLIRVALQLVRLKPGT